MGLRIVSKIKYYNKRSANSVYSSQELSVTSVGLYFSNVEYFIKA